MLRRDAVISVCGLQRGEEEEAPPITVVTPGHYYLQNGAYYVIYEESELTGLAGTRTMLKITDNTVTVTRLGTYPSQLMFEDGRRHLSLYHTEYGDLAVAVTTQSITCELAPGGGSVDVEYAVEIDNQPVGINHLKVEVKVPAFAEEKGEL